MANPAGAIFVGIGIAVVLILLCLHQSNGSPSGMSNDDVRRAALKIVYPLPDCSKSWIGGTVEKCDQAAQRLAERRKEFGAFEPTWMRDAIIHWLDFAERNIKEAREDCLTQASRKSLDEYRDRTRGEDERALAILKSIGKR